MATRVAARYLPRKYSSGRFGGVEEKKALDNVCVKKTEQVKVEKLAITGQKLARSPAVSTVGSVSQPSGSEKVSTDKAKNYAVVGGAVTAMAALGWYLKANPKKEQERD